MLELADDQLQVGMVARNAQAMLDFYGKTLGLPRSEMIPNGTLELPNGTLHLFAAGSNLIKIMVPTEVPARQDSDGEPTQATGIRYWTLIVKNLDKLVEECCEGGATLLGEINQIGSIRFAVLNDPDGNCLEFNEFV